MHIVYIYWEYWESEKQLLFNEADSILKCIRNNWRDIGSYFMVIAFKRANFSSKFSFCR